MKLIKYMLLILCLCSIGAIAPDNPTTNRNYVKICILNENNEVLLVEHSKTWELIGGEYNTTKNLQEYVEQLGMSSGVELTDIRLRGLFSVYWNDREKPFVYHYYSARYKAGDIKPPDDCTGAMWADVNKAREVMEYEDMLWMYESILKSENLWGGSYKILKNREKGTRKVVKLVDYFKLN